MLRDLIAADKVKPSVIVSHELPLADAPRLLAYRGEREIAERAIAVLAGANDV